MTRIRLGLARAAVILASLLLWTWTAVKVVVALIGASTVGDDFNQLLERLPRWSEWLLSTQWWVPSALAVALTSFLIWLNWPVAHVQNSPPQSPSKKKKLTKIKGKSFRNEEVMLDGYSYSDCDFVNVRFIYNGGKTEILGNNISGFVLGTQVPEIEQYVGMLNSFGLLKIPVVHGKETLKPSNPMPERRADKLSI